MRVDAAGRTGKTSQTGGTRKAAGSGASFVVDEGEPAAQAAPAGAAAAVTGIDAILALQGVDGALQAKRKAVKRGRTLLDTLEDIRAELVVGIVNPARLQKLVGLLQQAKEQSDPKLDALVADIELRARVELAKLGHFPGF